MKKFYGVIGNPPYQEETEGNGRANPIYPDFMDAAYEVGERVELITPARFLFNAGQTKKTWNERMLGDAHLKVLEYEPDGEKVFPNTDIKGGVAVTYRDETRRGEPIGLFIPDDNLRAINAKVMMVTGHGSRVTGHGSRVTGHWPISWLGRCRIASRSGCARSVPSLSR